MRIQLKEKYKEREGDLGSNPGPVGYQVLSPPLGHSHASDYTITNK